ncbi:tyrosine-type recombinase/integrase [Nonomuraea sp. NPDC050691]|uniref:tyrosine-type recombinase/integrase n=1 Tax=Nonomuraea sp. NPDC050691 TaxID=3155661 RepID=UPI0033C2FA3D
MLRWFLNDVRGRFPDSPVLFADESGGALHRGTIRNRLRYLMHLEGRPETGRFSPHALRRTCATHNYERGVDLVAIQQLLGHWTVSSTMRYVRPSAAFNEDAYRRAVTSTLAALCTALECSPDDLIEVDTTSVEQPARRSRRPSPRPPPAAGLCRHCDLSGRAAMGQRQRDCVDCGGPVGIIDRLHCCRCLKRLDEATANAPCPGCGK